MNGMTTTTQENDMSKTNDNAPRVEAWDEDLIVLGAASVETKGGSGQQEFPGLGNPMPVGISEE